jgi:hypothetical protein
MAPVRRSFYNQALGNGSIIGRELKGWNTATIWPRIRAEDVRIACGRTGRVVLTAQPRVAIGQRLASF